MQGGDEVFLQALGVDHVVGDLAQGHDRVLVLVPVLHQFKGPVRLLVGSVEHPAEVPEELVAHVFDRGVSVGSSTGLGLALARALVEAL